MKARNIIATALTTVSIIAASSSFAAGNSGSNRYGQPLDIAEVISLQESQSPSGPIVEARMTYRDSQGAVHAVTYLKQADHQG